jgi:malate dehydrogenase (oxaloacetate-decarboxylating)(NADP+)
VAVVTNGTAVLGLGNIGPLAGKPVMEGKGVLFKKFAGIDVFDIEIDENDPDKLVDIIASLEPTFGGINLEDIKAPECFYVEQKLRERMKIPVFHDDQHGTAIIVPPPRCSTACAWWARRSTRSSWCAPAPALPPSPVWTCWSRWGQPREHLYDRLQGRGDTKGRGRPRPVKARYAQDTDARTLADIVAGADIFLGLSTAGVLKPEMVKPWHRRPLILAWPTRPRRSCRRRPRPCGPTRSSPPAAPTTRTR